MDHDKYRELGGKMSEETFSLLYPSVYCFVQNFVESFIASWDLKDNLEDYGNFDKALMHQLDFIDSIGGIGAMNGVSDLDIKSAETEGFKYEINAQTERFEGIPLSPLAKQLVLRELRKNGYLSRCLHA